jgi:uncharacterized membrane protein
MLSYITNRYTYVGKPLSQAIPLAVQTIFSKGSLFLIGAYLAPFAFLPLLSPKWCIPALVILLSGILSTSVGQHNYLSQYQGVAIPFLFIAFMEVLPRILGNQQVQSDIKRTRNRVVAESIKFVAFMDVRPRIVGNQQVKSDINRTRNRVVTESIVIMVIISCFFVSKGRIRLASLPNQHAEAVNQEIALIPNNATVTASNIDFPHLCSRTNTYLDAWEGDGLSFGSGIQKFDFGFSDKDTEYVLIDYKDFGFFETEINLMSTNYKLIKAIDGVFLYQLNS